MEDYAMEVEKFSDESYDSDSSHISSISVSINSPLLDDSEYPFLLDIWRQALKERLEDFKEQYACMKEMLWHEKQILLATNLGETRSEKERKYRDLEEIINEKLQIRLKIIEQERQIRLLMVQRNFEAEKQSIIQNFEEEKQKLLETIKRNIEEKIRIFSSKNQPDEQDFSADEDHYAAVAKMPKRKEQVTVNGPYIVYRLRDEEILHDCTTIRKALRKF